ncbi:hypothetical protein [Candidatus Rhabdochlamydia oedothoracis]|nr:hypothetical protein [Candidatus Rhabdochlamydia oedothoracis]
MQSAGFLDQFLEELLKLAEQLGCIDAQRLPVDGFFFQRKRRRRAS